MSLRSIAPVINTVIGLFPAVSNPIPPGMNRIGNHCFVDRSRSHAQLPVINSGLTVTRGESRLTRRTVRSPPENLF